MGRAEVSANIEPSRNGYDLLTARDNTTEAIDYAARKT